MLLTGARKAGKLTWFLSVIRPCPSLSLCVCPCVRLSKFFEMIHFVLGASFPTDPEREPFEFEQKSPWGKGRCGCQKFWPNGKIR